MLLPKLFSGSSPLIIFSFFTGTLLNCLKLSSTMTLVSKVEADRFILLILISTGYLLLISRLLPWLEERLKQGYHSLSFLYPLATLVLDLLFFKDSTVFALVLAQYLLTITGISLVEESLKLFQTKCLSPLASEGEKESVGLAEELGHIFGSIVLLFVSAPIMPLMLSLSASLAYFVFRQDILMRLSFFAGRSEAPVTSEETARQLAKPLLVFLTGLGLIKLSYSLLLYEGYQQLRLQEQDPKEVFLYVSLGQGVLIVLLVLLRSKLPWLTNWIRKSLIYLWAQVSFLTLGTLFASPWMLIAAGSIRKSLNHSFLSSALLDLSLQLPQSFFSPIKRRSEFLSQITGMMLIVLIGYLYYTVIHAQAVLTVFVILECVAVSIALRTVAKKIVSFHLEAIRSSDPGQALASCYGLKMQAPQAAKAPLLELLRTTRSTHLKRSLIQTLEKFPDPVVAEAILKEFDKLDREDLKVCCVKALHKIGDRSIRHRLLDGLELIPFEQQLFEQFRWRLYLSISASEFVEAEKKLFRMIEVEKKDPTSRALANFMLVLSEIVRETGHDLSESFREFMRAPYSRRVRTNAATGLYLLRPQDPELTEYLIQLKTSPDKNDRNAWVFFQGEVENNSSVEEVKKISGDFQHKNSVALLALMKLGDLSAAGWIADYFSGLALEESTVLIHYLNYVRNQESRLEFYKQVITKYPESIEKLLTVMSYSKRDFGDDFQKILLELKFLGIDTSGYAKLVRFGHYKTG